MRLFDHILPLSVLFFVFALSVNTAKGQQIDTLKTDTIRVGEQDLPKHSPMKASIFSAVIPGLGQAYNKKYWKIPIVYAGIGIPLYYAKEQNDLFNEKYSAYKNRLNHDSSDAFLEMGNFYTNDGLLTSMDINRRNRDLMLIVGGLVYVLQIVDATVDAHLFYFDVNDDLSLNYQPFIYYSKNDRDTVKGLSLCLTF